GVARVLADEVLVLRNGRTEELTDADAFFAGPASDYGRDLLRTTEQQMLVREAATAAGPPAEASTGAA
ncbi:MAG TPA: hypothetical protein VFF79_10735, partial [Conexibacter sp.]|nr:hypothetical protein [Conexibacter sp.]